MVGIIGHSKIRSRLENLLAKSAVPHALLFAGAHSIGKKLVAQELYQTLFCEHKSPYGGCGNCKNCSLFAARSIPDCTIVDCRDRETASVETLRKILFELNLKVSKGQSKVLILDNIEHLPEQAQNILLKSLEEPRPDTYFCLITASVSRVLRTIQSRCQVWHFDSLQTAEVKTILENTYGNDPEHANNNWGELAVFAEGSLESVQHLLSGSEHWEVAKKFIDCLADKNLPKTLDIVQTLKPKKESMPAVLAVVRVLARSNMIEEEDSEMKLAWSVLLTNAIDAEAMIMQRNLSLELVLSNLAVSFLSPSKTLSFTSIGNDARVLSNIAV